MKYNKKKGISSKIAGKRLEQTFCALGIRDFEDFVYDNEKWKKLGKKKGKKNGKEKGKEKSCLITTKKQYYKWINEGIPKCKVKYVAEYFNVPGTLFTDERIDDNDFRKKIEKANPDKNTNYQIDLPITSIKEDFKNWSKKQSYDIIKKCIESSKIDLNDIKLFENEKDQDLENFLAFLMILAIHSGINWKGWVEKNVNLPDKQQAIRNLFYILNNSSSYGPTLRTLYTLQKFSKNRVKKNLEIIKDEELKEVIEKYVLKDNIIKYIIEKAYEAKGKYYLREIEKVLKDLKNEWKEDIQVLDCYGKLKEYDKTKSEARRIDAIAPSQAKIDDEIKLTVQVCLPDSPPLGIENLNCKQNLSKMEKKSDDITLEFPIDRKTGQLESAYIRIVIVTSDFEIDESQKQKDIEIPPKQDSKQVTFHLKAKKTGCCTIHVEVNAIEKDIFLGDIFIETTVKENVIITDSSNFYTISQLYFNIDVSQKDSKLPKIVSHESLAYFLINKDPRIVQQQFVGIEASRLRESFSDVSDKTTEKLDLENGNCIELPVYYDEDDELEIPGVDEDNLDLVNLRNFMYKVQYYWIGWYKIKGSEKEHMISEQVEERKVNQSQRIKFLPRKDYEYIIIAISTDKEILQKILDLSEKQPLNLSTEKQILNLIWLKYT